MGLISRLLPRDYREQVLGDLQERGFSVRDIASVLPRIWWSAARRTLRVPNLSGASEAQLRQRLTQLRRWRFTLALLHVSVFLRLVLQNVGLHIPRWPQLLVPLVALPFFFMGMMAAYEFQKLHPPATPQGRDAWAARYRSELSGLVFMTPHGFLVPARLALGWLGDSHPFRDALILTCLLAPLARLFWKELRAFA